MHYLDCEFNYALTVTTKMTSRNDGGGFPRLSMPMITMQSVLIPEYSNKPDQVEPSLPVLYRRVCSKPASGTTSNDAKTCQLPFQDGDKLSRYNASAVGRRSSSKQTSATSKVEKQRNDAARKGLNQKLHAEHREFMENLKLEQESTFLVKSAAAVIVQRYTRGLSVRMKRHPEKYDTLRTSLVTHYTKEDLSELVAQAIRRSGVVHSPND